MLQETVQVLHYSSDLSACFTNLSAAPLLAGWYGADFMCFIPFCAINRAKSSATNYGPLSVTTCFGSPFLEKMLRRTAMVLVAVAVVMIITSGHFECASNTISSILPKNGPAKSR